MPTGVYIRTKPVWNKGLTKNTDKRLNYYRPTIFKNGHKKGIIAWNKGLSISNETKKKIKENNARYWLGKKRIQETKDKISSKLKGVIIGHKWGKGKNHYNWQGGISFKPYGLEFNEDLKEVIRNRDRRKCQICEMIELENCQRLDVHHIDYDKRNNDPKNLIALCHSCHAKTNFNREHWITYFNNKEYE